MKLFVLLLAVALVAQACEKYEGKGGKLNPGECLKKENNVRYHEVCPEPQVCNTESAENLVKCSDPEKGLPGVYCKDNNDCKSKQCDIKAHKCEGKKKEDPCATIDECNPGLRCIDKAPVGPEIPKICNDAIAIGGACTKDDDCIVPTICTGGKCSLIGTLKNGMKATDKLQCESFYTAKDKGGADDVCMESPKLAKNENEMSAPPRCENENANHCTYKVGGADQTIPCQCGRTESGNKYCQLFPGNIKIDTVSFTL